MSKFLSALEPLEYPAFRRVWGGNIVSNFGTMVQSVGAAWLMLSLTDSVDMVALVQTAVALPIMLFSYFGGTMADTYSRRSIMIVSQWFMLAASAMLAALAFIGVVSPWTLLLFTFLIGCGTAMNNPSWHASVGDLVPKKSLPAAISLNSVGFNIARSAGPAVGGLVVALGGAAAAFALNSASYVGVLFALSRWRPRIAERSVPPESIGAAMVSGLRYVAMSPNIGTVLIRAFVFGFSVVAVLALLPVVSDTLLGGGPLVFGGMLGSFGLGAVAGAMSSVRLQLVLRSETIVRLAFIGFAICAVVTGASQTPWITGPALMIGGACWVLAMTLFNVSVQLLAPRWVVGRALSIYQTVTFAGMALGSWVWGLMGEAYGLQFTLTVASATMIACAALGLILPLPKRETPNLDPVSKWQEPDLELDIQRQSGPIRLQISYRIRAENVPVFLEAMAKRKRVRLRDGARDWTLMRDLSVPEVWTECYRTATWADYVRHKSRATEYDHDIWEQLLSVHEGPERPQIQRFIERQTKQSASFPAPGNTNELL